MRVHWASGGREAASYPSYVYPLLTESRMHQQPHVSNADTIGIQLLQSQARSKLSSFALQACQQLSTFRKKNGNHALFPFQAFGLGRWSCSAPVARGAGQKLLLKALLSPRGLPIRALLFASRLGPLIFGNSDVLDRCLRAPGAWSVAHDWEHPAALTHL